MSGTQWQWPTNFVCLVRMIYNEGQLTWRTQHLLFLNCLSTEGSCRKIHFLNSLTVAYKDVLSGRVRLILKGSLNEEHSTFCAQNLITCKVFSWKSSLALGDRFLESVYIQSRSVHNEWQFTWRTQHLLCFISFSNQFILQSKGWPVKAAQSGPKDVATDCTWPFSPSPTIVFPSNLHWNIKIVHLNSFMAKIIT